MVQPNKPLSEDKEKTAKEVTPLGEQTEVIEQSPELKEAKEDLSHEELAQVREKIEKEDLGESVRQYAGQQAQSMKLLDDEKKIKKLLELAQSKGVVYAVEVAKKMDDPYVLDFLHDTLAKQGYYKDFVK